MRNKILAYAARIREILRLVVRPAEGERQSSLTTRFGRAALWTVSGTVASRGIALLLGIALAHILLVDRYGRFNFIQSSLGMVATLCGLSMGATTSRHLALLRDTDRARCGRIVALGEVTTLLMGALGTAAVWSAADLIARFFPAQQGLQNLLRLGAPMILFGLFNGVQIGALTGMEQFRWVTTASLLTGVLMGAGNVMGGFFFGTEGAVAGGALGSGLACAVNAVLVYRVLARTGIPVTRASYRDCYKEYRLLWSYSLPSWLQSLLFMGGTWVGQAMVMRSGEDGAAQWASYAVANQWKWAALYVPATLSSITLPFLANLHGRGETRRLTRFLKYQLGMNAAFAAVVMAGILLLSPWIAAAYGEGFATAKTCLRLLSVSIVFTACSSVLRQHLLGLGLVWTYTGYLAIYLAVLLGGLNYGLARWQTPAVSFAAATASAEIVMFTLLFARHLYRNRGRHEEGPDGTR